MSIQKLYDNYLASKWALQPWQKYLDILKPWTAKKAPRSITFYRYEFKRD